MLNRDDPLRYMALVCGVAGEMHLLNLQRMVGETQAHGVVRLFEAHVERTSCCARDVTFASSVSPADCADIKRANKSADRVDSVDLSQEYILADVSAYCAARPRYSVRQQCRDCSTGPPLTSDVDNIGKGDRAATDPCGGNRVCVTSISRSCRSQDAP